MRLRSGSIQRAAVASITFPGHAGAAKAPEARGALSYQLIIGGVVLLALLSAAVYSTSALRRR
jgi:hypothetical protein